MDTRGLIAAALVLVGTLFVSGCRGVAEVIAPGHGHRDSLCMDIQPIPAIRSGVFPADWPFRIVLKQVDRPAAGDIGRADRRTPPGIEPTVLRVFQARWGKEGVLDPGSSPWELYRKPGGQPERADAGADADLADLGLRLVLDGIEVHDDRSILGPSVLVPTVLWPVAGVILAWGHWDRFEVRAAGVGLKLVDLHTGLVAWELSREARVEMRLNFFERSDLRSWNLLAFVFCPQWFPPQDRRVFESLAPFLLEPALGEIDVFLLDAVPKHTYRITWTRPTMGGPEFEFRCKDKVIVARGEGAVSGDAKNGAVVCALKDRILLAVEVGKEVKAEDAGDAPYVVSVRLLEDESGREIDLYPQRPGVLDEVVGGSAPAPKRSTAAAPTAEASRGPGEGPAIPPRNRVRIPFLADAVPGGRRTYRLIAVDSREERSEATLTIEAVPGRP